MTKSKLCAIYTLDGLDMTGLVSSPKALDKAKWQALVLKARLRYNAIAEAEDEADAAILSTVTEEEWRLYEAGAIHRLVVLLHPEAKLAVPDVIDCEW